MAWFYFLGFIQLVFESFAYCLERIAEGENNPDDTTIPIRVCLRFEFDIDFPNTKLKRLQV